MCFSKPKMPASPEPKVQEQDAAVSAARDNERRRIAAASGRNSTMLTGGAGITSPATTSAKTLLGQ